ncbi:beta-ketoacyl synthase, partial [Streptomyces sp. SID625]|nr:beta-ketoacyl synthase [Streptomyces sp. SID625]
RLTGRTVLVLGSAEAARALVPEAAAHGVTVSADRAALAEADHVLFAPGLPDGTQGAEPVDVAVEFARLVADIAALSGRRPLLWCLTSGVREAVDADALAQSPLWGMGRVAASEHPEFWGGVVDFPSGPPAELPVRLLFGLLHLRPAEPVVALTAEGVRVPRLAPAELAAGGEPFACRPDGTYLITGGLGVLGL